MKTYKMHAGVAAHACAKHSRYGRSPYVLAKIARAAHQYALDLLWRVAVKGGATL